MMLAETFVDFDGKRRRHADGKLWVDPQRAAAEYPAIVQKVREIAKEHGYAIGVHGSMVRDLDLIACPWADTASAKELLVNAITTALDGHVTDSASKPGGYKPHGRRAWLIGLPGGLILDLSVMPLIQKEDE